MIHHDYHICTIPYHFFFKYFCAVTQGQCLKSLLKLNRSSILHFIEPSSLCKHFWFPWSTVVANKDSVIDSLSVSCLVWWYILMGRWTDRQTHINKRHSFVWQFSVINFICHIFVPIVHSFFFLFLFLLCSFKRVNFSQLSIVPHCLTVPRIYDAVQFCPYVCLSVRLSCLVSLRLPIQYCTLIIVLLLWIIYSKRIL